MNRVECLKSNLAALTSELSGTHTKLLVVSKTQSIDDIRTLYQLGQRDFGENRVQELEEKAIALSDLSEIRWHLIGHLQSNKVNKLAKIKHLVAIHSVDSLELAQKLVHAFKGHTTSVGLFLQVNTSHEEEKSGFESFEELKAVVDFLQPFKTPVYLQGLMTMGTIRTENPELEARRCFADLAHIRERLAPLKLDLSMGMSGDYLMARDAGSDWVRVGSKIFKV